MKDKVVICGLMKFYNILRLLIFLFSLGLISGCSYHYESISWSEFTPPTTPNYFIVCPSSTCNGRSYPSPVFPGSQANLFSAVKEVISKQPRTSIVSIDATTYSLVAVQRTLIFRFPDVIQIKIIPHNSNQSSILLYSKSVYGHYDFGVNESRALLWIDLFSETLKNN